MMHLNKPGENVLVAGTMTKARIVAGSQDLTVPPEGDRCHGGVSMSGKAFFSRDIPSAEMFVSSK